MGFHSLNVGQAAEAGFIFRAIQHGLSVSRPMFDTEKYDFITDSKTEMHRVQVKSVLTGTKAIVAHGKNRKDRYSSAQCDFIAIWCVETDEWYIIPTDEVEGRSINLKEKYSKYREAWNQLK
jgi:hypothetical protein